MTILIVAWAFILLWAVGAAIGSLAGLNRERTSTSVVAELAAGLSLMTVITSSVLMLGGRITLSLVYGAFGAVAVLWLFRGKRRRSPVGLRIPEDQAARALLGFSFAVWVVHAFGSLRDRLQWDAWAFWTFKAKVLFLEGRLPDSLLTLAGPYPWTHPEYPLALPTFDWFLYAHRGAPETELASFAGAVWLGILPIVLYKSVSEITGARWGAAAALGAIAFWPITFLAVGGHAEILISLGMLAAAIELANGLSDGGRDAVLRFGLALSLAVLSKNEGLAMAVAGVSAATLSLWAAGNRNFRYYVGLCLPLAVVAPWFIYARSIGVSAEHIGVPPSASDILQRIPFLFGTFVDLFTTRAWIPLPFIIAAGIYARQARRGTDGRAAWGFVLAYFAVTQLVYLFTPLDLEWLVINSYFRIVGVTIPALVYLSLRELGLFTRSPARLGAAPPSDAALV